MGSKAISRHHGLAKGHHPEMPLAELPVSLPGAQTRSCTHPACSQPALVACQAGCFPPAFSLPSLCFGWAPLESGFLPMGSSQDNGAMVKVKVFRVWSLSNHITSLNFPPPKTKSIPRGWSPRSRTLHALNWKHTDIEGEISKTGLLEAASASSYMTLHSAPCSSTSLEPLGQVISMLGIWHRLNHSAAVRPSTVAISETELERKGFILLRLKTLKTVFE